MKRLNVYIDGFNLYFGIAEAGYNSLKWLDLYLLANNIKHNTHNLNEVKYFTSRINNDIAKQKRQNTYLDALATRPISIIYGQFRTNLQYCKLCGGSWYESKEKMTDVNIASHILKDAFQDKFDVAILISGDSDLTPPVKNVIELFPNKEVRIAFPPNRDSNDLKKSATGSFSIGRKKLEASQLPNELLDKYGNMLMKPSNWI